LGLRDTKMIAMIDVDPTNPNRLFVAALGHPYGPNAERGIFRSSDGGQTFQKVLYKDEYTSGNDVRIDPSDPYTVYATLWQQQQSFIEGAAFGGAGTQIYKSTDGGDTWRVLTEGLPQVIQANLAIAPSNPSTLYATIAAAGAGSRARIRGPSAASAAAICRRSPWTGRTRTWCTARAPSSGAPRTAASPGAPSAAPPAATTIRRPGSIPRTPISFCSCRIR